MSLSVQFEREEQALEDDLANGLIDNAEYNKQMSQLQRDFRYEAEEEADRARDHVMDSYGY